MSGLYDMPNGALMDPRSAMLMQTGLGLMANSGPSLMPVSFGQSLGKAGAQGVNAYNQTLQANQQLLEAQRAEQERKKREAAMAQLKADPRFAGMGALLDVAPAAAIQQAFQKPEKPESPFAKINPKDYTQESVLKFSMTKNPADLVAAPDAPKPPAESDLSKLTRERDALPQGHPNRALYDAKIKKLTTHQPLVTVDNRQENEFSKKLGAELGEQYAGLMKSDMNAPTNIAKYQRLGGLLSQVGTGKFKGTTVELKAAAKSMGVDLNALGVADDVAPAQAARALANQLALELRNPAGGAGMPGALSDQDRQFLLQMIPSLESDPGAWPKMIEYRVKLAEREQKVARMAREYRKKSGKFDEGFFDELQEWSAKNPLFPELPKSPAPAAPNVQSLIDKYAPK